MITRVDSMVVYETRQEQKIVEANSFVKTTSAGCPGGKARTEMVETNPFCRDNKYCVEVLVVQETKQEQK